jgi:hypothetical protein
MRQYKSIYKHYELEQAFSHEKCISVLPQFVLRCYLIKFFISIQNLLFDFVAGGWK